jgi:hypothetical protein
MHSFLKWRDRLQVAPDSRAVNAVIRDYVSGLVPSDVNGLPQTCQIAITASPADIQAAAVTLLHAELIYAGDPHTAAFLHEIAQTFAAASVRLGQVQGRPEITP